MARITETAQATHYRKDSEDDGTQADWDDQAC
jgi:hypothetical protein